MDAQGSLSTPTLSTWTLQQQVHPPELVFRSLQPGDYAALKALHQELFPIDYDEHFYQKATTSADRLFSFAALSQQHELVGFITARLMYAYECDPVDRHHVGLGSPALANAPLVYILTLGVAPTWQQRGIARMLLQHVHHRAQTMRWHAVFLHVISYNEAAIRLYTGQAYRCAAFLKNFYVINSGRQVNANQYHYDAYLYVLLLGDMGGAMHGMLGWHGMNALNMAMAPIRNALGHINWGCMPWLCSGQRGSMPSLGLFTSMGSVDSVRHSPMQPPPPTPPPTPPPQSNQGSGCEMAGHKSSIGWASGPARRTHSAALQGVWTGGAEHDNATMQGNNRSYLQHQEPSLFQWLSSAGR